MSSTTDNRVTASETPFAPMNKTTVREILAIDQKSRLNAENTDFNADLVKIDDIKPVEWNFSEPTLTMASNSSGNRAMMSSEAFRKKFFEKYPIFKSINWNNICLAGGSLIDVLRGLPVNDFDFFFYGLTQEECEVRCKKLIDDFHESTVICSLQVMARNLREIIKKQKAAASDSKSKGKPLDEAIPKFVNFLDILASDSVNSKNLRDEYIKTVAKEATVMIMRPHASRFGIDDDKWENVVDFCKANGYKFDETTLEGSRMLPRSIFLYLTCAGDKNARQMTVQARKTQNCLTIKLAASYDNVIKIQIVFRCYSSIGEIIKGFDLGSSAIASNGNDVLLSQLGAFCYSRGVNIFDASRVSTTYEKRLRKYADRGFNVILPELDVLKLSNKPELKYRVPTVLNLPHMPALVSEVNGNRVVVQRWLPRNGCSYSDESMTSDSGNDYDDGEDKDITVSVQMNLKYMLAGKLDMLHYGGMYGNISEIKEIFDAPIDLEFRYIQMYYDRIKRELCRNKLDASMIRGFLPLTNLQKIAAIIEDADASANKDASTGADKDAPATKKPIHQALAEIVEENRAHAIKLRDQINEQRNKVVWIDKNPSGQGIIISGSIKPVEITAEQWYGEYFSR